MLYKQGMYLYFIFDLWGGIFIESTFVAPKSFKKEHFFKILSLFQTIIAIIM